MWTVNEYGAGLRDLVADGQNLDRWLDFKNFQVFEEATTYTALQYFTRARAASICIAHASRGLVPPDPWADAGQRLAWGQEQFGDRWLLLTGEERALIDRLGATCDRLDDPSCTQAIFTGLQTSADDIYHLRRLGPGRYLCDPPGRNAAAYEVEIEDAIMRPLVSGAEAKRYVAISTDRYLLFPYRATSQGIALIPSTEMQANFPKAWAHLSHFQLALRGREPKRNLDGSELRPFDTSFWYRFGRNQNLDKQHLPKLIVAQTVPSMRVTIDEMGEFAPNNVRVNGILAAETDDPWFLLKVLNAPVADWVFRRIAKPKDGGWFEANKQFIAPLPIPRAKRSERAAIAHHARELQRLHTLRRDLLARIDRRLRTVPRRPRPFSWLFAGLAEAHAREHDLPAALGARERRKRARAAYEADVAARCHALGAALRPGATLDATIEDGELRFSADGAPVIDRVFVTTTEAAFILAQWKIVATTFEPTERTGGNKLATLLRNLAVVDNPAVVEQVVNAASQLQTCEAEIGAAETRLNALTFQLYGLSPAERQLIDAG